MPPLASGQVIAGRMKLERKLGEGGMGSVWVAEHIALGTSVAVKFIDPELLEKSPELRERFSREAAIAAKITSPHVVRTFDFGNLDDGTPYLVMELLSGESLYERLVRERPLPPALAVEIIRQTAKALDDAHLHGVVHRDIKPGNIFLTQSGRDVFVKVLDFGIAKNVDPTRGDHSTKTGMTLGTPAYMSPEHLMSSKGVDFQADLWALAVTAYETLFGVQPFRGETVPSLIVAIHGQTFDAPSSQAGTASRVTNLGSLDGFFARAFAKTPAGRFATALDLADGLAAAIDGRPMVARDTPASRTAYGAPLVSAGETAKGETVIKAAQPATDPGAPIDAESAEAKAAPGDGGQRTEYGAPVAPEQGTKLSSAPSPGAAAAPAPKARDGVAPPPAAPARVAAKRPGWMIPAAVVGAGGLGLALWMGMRSGDNTGTDSTASASSGTQAPPPSASNGQAGPRPSAAPSATGKPSGSEEPMSAPEFDVAAGVFSFSQADKDVFVSAFHVRALDTARPTLDAAFASCHDTSMVPCTEAQWEKACLQDPSVGKRATWTASESNGRAVIRGGEKGCKDRATASFRGGDRSALCCDTAIAAQSAGEWTIDAVKPLAGKMNTYMTAMNHEDIDGLVAVYGETVTFNGTDRSKGSLKSLGKGWFGQHPDQTYALGVCNIIVGSSWTGGCPAIIYRDGKLNRLDVKLGWEADHVSLVDESNVRSLE